MRKHVLGATGPQVSIIGLGCMAMSGSYGPADRDESLATLHTALDQGITLLDTGDFYGMGHNELLINEALRDYPRDQVQISVKFGALRDASGSWLGYDARPEAVRNFLAYSLVRLGVDYIDIYRPARVDPNVPIEETIGAIAGLIQAGYVRYIGLSEAGTETIRRAQSVHPIADLQIEYSLLSREIERNILPVCRDLGIGITAYGVLSRGLLGGYYTKDRQIAPGDFRVRGPRFQGENLDQNLALVDALRSLAQAQGVTVAQMAVAWVLSRGADIVPLIGAKTRERLLESLGAMDLVLSPQDLQQIEQAVPSSAVAGERYDPHAMAMLDSERSPGA